MKWNCHRSALELLALQLLLLSVPVTAGGDVSHRKTIALAVDRTRVLEKNFLGVNGTYHGFAWMPEQLNKGMSDGDRAREFDRVHRMGLRMARTWYRPDWACGSTIYNAFDWESVKMKAFYKWLQAMKERNVDVALQSGWWFTRDTYYGEPGPNPDTDVDRYALWVSESVNQIVTVRGFTNVKYLMLFTEGTSYPSGNVPDGLTEWAYYKRVVTAMHRKLAADGRRDLVKFVGPNNTGDGRHLREAVHELNDIIDIYSGHSYNKDGYGGWFKLCQGMQKLVAATGKPLWLDEYGKQDETYRLTPDYGNYIAQAVAASINAGNQTSQIWILFDQQYVSTSMNNVNNLTNADSFYKGVHRWGACKWPRDTIDNPTHPYPHWYALSLMSKYLRGGPGTKTYRTTHSGGVYLSAVQHPGEDWTFMVVNGTYSEQHFSIDIGRTLDKDIYRYAYDPSTVVPTEAAAIFGYDSVFPKTGASVSDTLPARAVALYSTLRGTPRQFPAHPAGLKATLVGQSDVQLTWKDQANNEKGFTIERSEDGAGYLLLTTQPPDSTSFSDKTISPATDYHYRVLAYGDEGGRQHSDAVTTIRIPVNRAQVARWPFNNTMENAIGGGSRAERHGTTFTLDAAEGSHALLFGGKNFVDAGLINLGNQFTLAMWVKIDPKAKGIQTLAANAGGAYNVDGFELFVNTWNTSDGRIILQSGNGKTGTAAASPPHTITRGMWQHVAVTVDRKKGLAEVYHQGNKVKGSNKVRTNFKVRGPITLGCMPNGQYYLNGALDDVRIYTYILADDAIKSLATVLKK